MCLDNSTQQGTGSNAEYIYLSAFCKSEPGSEGNGSSEEEENVAGGRDHVRNN